MKRRIFEFLKRDSINFDLTTDKTGLEYQEDLFESYFMDKNEYSSRKTKKEYVFLHHTAGWHNPFNCIDGWNKDNRGMIGTEFVIGGQSIRDNDNSFDGKILQSFPDGYYAWHLGKTNSQYMHKHSIGIELCNFGQLKGGKTWAKQRVHVNQKIDLKEPFRGFKSWHRYSDKQIEKLKHTLLFVAERDNIQITEGLPMLIKRIGAKAFEFREEAYNGFTKGLWSHGNARKDKFDCFPQQELIDMLLSL